MIKDIVISYWSHNEEAGTWFCWVYVQTNFKFSEWMDEFCPTASWEFRFNSGNPAYIVTIKDAQEALLFQLRWCATQ